MNTAKQRVNKILTGLGIFLVLGLFHGKVAQSEVVRPVGIEKKNCKISESRDKEIGRKSATLRTALEYASEKDSSLRACTKSITIENNVDLKDPLLVSAQGINGSYEIKGNSNSRIALDFTGMKEKACAIKFKDTHDITLKNIKIINAPGNALCFSEGTNNITLDNVEIANADGSAIVVFKDSYSITIMPDVSIHDIKGDGIKITNTNISGDDPAVTLLATERMLETGGKTDADGLVDFGTSSGKDFVMKAIGKGGDKYDYVSSEADVKVMFSKIEINQDTGKVLIEGAAVRKDTVCVPAILYDASIKDQFVSELSRLHIYATSFQNGGAVANKDAAFLAYVGKKMDCADPANCSHGIVTDSSGFEASANYGGQFSFQLDTDALLARVNQGRSDPLTKIKNIVVVPEMVSGTIASSTKPISIENTNIPDDRCGSGQSSGGNQGVSDGTGSSGGDIIIGWKTLNECQRAGNRSAEFDTDGDGLKDIAEDLNGNCDDCVDTATEFSCWKNPDSDGDGIPDGKELNGGDCTANPTSSACDVDSDGLSNAYDEDSDDDTLSDFIEDRFRTFAQSNKGLFYKWQSAGTLVPYKDGNGNTKECTDWLAEISKADRGAAYGIFLVKKDRSGDPQPYQFEGYDTDRYDRVLLACRNIGIRQETNLNGNKDDESETDLYNKDTNGDGVDDNLCRGDFDSVTGECTFRCKINELFKGMDAEKYVDADAAGDPYRLKKDADGEYVVFKQDWQSIKTACSDIDQDGIPDCVENPEGTCNPCQNPGNLGQNLCNYKKDSDGDTLPDGKASGVVASDKCPFTSGEDCDRLHIYTHRPALAFFLDRDGDNLRDGEEECPNITPIGAPVETPATEGAEGSNAGGAASQVVEPVVCRPDGEIVKIGGLGGRLTTETDPLSKDTDNDTIDDYTEVFLWNRYTNAAAEDTDGDGLPDAWELEGPNATPIKEGGYVIRYNALCNTVNKLGTAATITASAATHFFYGTDPQNKDTDGDGIEDLKEVQGLESGDVSSLLLTQLTVGIDLISNPLSKDSDGDGLEDGAEYDGMMNYNESNPCDVNTDHQGAPDSDPRDPNNKDACPSDANPNCKAVSGGGGTGPDSDSDGEPDDIEARFFDQTLDTDGDGLTDGVGDQDSDGDGLLDGEEDKNHNGTIETTGAPETLETDPKDSDTDKDGLSDGVEKRMGTNPNDNDTDKDCIKDGVEVNQNEFSSFTGTDTNPTTPDSDGDGLCDGNNSATNFLTADGQTVTCRSGEDKDCKGFVNKDPNTGRFLETDPRLADTDGDGFGDQGEACAGSGICANIGQATDGPSGGACGNTLYDGRKMTGPTSTFYVLGLLALLNRIVVMRLRKRTPPL